MFNEKNHLAIGIDGNPQISILPGLHMHRGLNGQVHRHRSPDGEDMAGGAGGASHRPWPCLGVPPNGWFLLGKIPLKWMILGYAYSGKPVFRVDLHLTKWDETLIHLSFSHCGSCNRLLARRVLQPEAARGDGSRAHVLSMKI